VEDGDEDADEDKELRMLRENRLRELKKTHNQKLEDKVKVRSFVRHSYHVEDFQLFCFIRVTASLGK